MLSDTQKKVLEKVVNVFQQNQIPFQITGGLAAAFYGANRPVYDIDIDVSKNDIQKIRELFRDNIVEDLHHLENEKFDLYLLTLKLDDTLVDISQVEDAYVFDNKGKRVRMNTNISNAEFISWEDINLPLQNKKELLGYKKILNRDIDLIDIEQMG